MHKLIINEQNIQDKIFRIRDMQVMLDRDLAELYGVKSIRLREQVKRNIKRFPDDFMFQLNENEIDFMVSQNAIPSKQHLGGAKPYAFTEQGVSMLSSVLKSDLAIEMSIEIIRAFINIRKIISQNLTIFQRLDSLEKQQSTTDTKLAKVLSAIEDKSIKPKQGIFYDGQIFDAYVFISDIIKSAKSSIVLIDNFVDETVLMLLSKRVSICRATIYTKTISKQLQLDLKKHNEQYLHVEIKKFNSSHDRFLIIDDKEVYHIGASLKDLGSKWFGFSKMDSESFEMMGRLSSSTGKARE